MRYGLSKCCVATAIAVMVTFGLSVAYAAGKHAICVSNDGEVMNTGADGSSCDANSDQTGIAIAHAKQNGAVADASVENSDGNSIVRANANGINASANAQIQANKCPATANASGTSSQAMSLCTQDNGKSRAFGVNGGSAKSESDSSCMTFSKAVGNGSVAQATCSNAGTNNKASASGGATAMASDTDPPVCDVSHGGHASVTSSQGPCKK